MKKQLAFYLLIGSFAWCGIISMSSVAAGDGGLESLRDNNSSLASTNRAPTAKKWQRDRDPIPRDYVQQPPLIPHKITGYKIDLRSNKCLTCHSWSRYKEVGATKISLTHFKDRGGSEMAEVAPRRYFCTQCHAPQVNAKPLVENNFKPITAIKQK